MTIDDLISALQSIKFERADYGDRPGAILVFIREDYSTARELADLVLSGDGERLYLE